MAEVVGLAASIIQIAGAGAKLSVALYNFTDSAVRADQDVKDIADDVELTSNALESVGKVFESEDAKSIVSKKAVQDAYNIIKKCRNVFDEVSEMMEKRRKIGKDGKKSLSMMGKLAWPMKEQRVELNRRRLESLKNSLVLLLHVLQLAQGQARGRMEKTVLEEERDKIRELHQRQQDSLKSLQALENRFCHVALDDEETLQGSSTASLVPTLELMTNAPAAKLPPLEKLSNPHVNTITIDLSAADGSDTSDSDATMADDHNEEHISAEELAKAANHVKKLLKRITRLQKSFDSDQKRHGKRHVHKMYQRFCRKFESGINVAQAALPPAHRSPSASLDLDKYDVGGPLECFDFDKFLQGQSDGTPFPEFDFDFFTGGQREHQQTNNPDLTPPSPSYGHSPLAPAGTVGSVPQSTPYMLSCSVPTAPIVASLRLPDSSDRRQEPITGQDQASPQDSQQIPGQGEPALPQCYLPPPVQMQWQFTSRPPAQLQQQQVQSQAQAQLQPELQRHHVQAQVQAQLQRQQVQALGQTQTQAQARARAQQRAQQNQGLYMPSPAMPMLNGPMRPQAEGQLPAWYRSPPHSQDHAPTIDFNAVSGPSITHTHALSDYQMQLMLVEQLLMARQERFDETQSVANSVPPAESEQNASIGSHISPSSYAWLSSTPSVNVATPEKEKRVRGRKGALTVEQRSQAAEMRVVETCYNCRSLKQKCDGNAPCGSCTNRNAKQEELPSGTCRNINITDARRDEYVAPDTGRSYAYTPIANKEAGSSAGNWMEVRSLASDDNGWADIRGHGCSDFQLHFRTGTDIQTYLNAPFSSFDYIQDFTSEPQKSTSRKHTKSSMSGSSPTTEPSPQVPSCTSFVSYEEGEETGHRVRTKKKRKTEQIEDEINEDEGDLVLVDNHVAGALLQPTKKGRPAKTGFTTHSANRDIVDVLLEQWTVPVY